MNRWGWGSLVAVTTTVGFLIKDLVVTRRPLGIRREKDHFSIVFAWNE